MSLSCLTRDLVVAHPNCCLFVSSVPWSSRDVFLKFSNFLHRLGSHVRVRWIRARSRGCGHRPYSPFLWCSTKEVVWGCCPRRNWRHSNSNHQYDSLIHHRPATTSKFPNFPSDLGSVEYNYWTSTSVLCTSNQTKPNQNSTEAPARLSEKAPSSDSFWP